MAEGIIRQIDFALTSAAVILFVVDAREGITPLDRAMAAKLRRTGKCVLLVANKADSPTPPPETGELARLGFGEALAVSAAHRLGLDELTAALGERIGQPAPAPPSPAMKIAIVGKRNVGKSTFINALAGQERVIVSEVPGTTRDSVDVNIQMQGQTITAIDTAGLRKTSKIADGIEYYSRHRTLRSIRRADVVLMMLDAPEPVGMVEKQLAGYILEQFKPTVLVVNKWDLAREKADQDEYGPYLEKVMPEIAYAPVAFTCATTGLGLAETVNLAGQLHRQARQRVPTAELNAAIEEIARRHAPKAGRGGAGPKILYATQIDIAPPTIVCFVNHLESFDAPYQRFLLNQLRQRLPFPEIPIRLIFRERRRQGK
jgi:GTP-binding protein